jgi:hypothetical protein
VADVPPEILQRWYELRKLTENAYHVSLSNGQFVEWVVAHLARQRPPAREPEQKPDRYLYRNGCHPLAAQWAYLNNQTGSVELYCAECGAATGGILMKSVRPEQLD